MHSVFLVQSTDKMAEKKECIEIFSLSLSLRIKHLDVLLAVSILPTFT